MAVRQRDWPHAMTALSTHDTKRGEDVRARIAVLAEVPELWERDPRRAARAGAAAGRGVRQPAVAGRLRCLADQRRPAARVRREGDARGRRAHHLDRSRRGLRVGRARSDRRPRRRRRHARPRSAGWSSGSSPAARSNSLALKLLALTIPGVPDVYQGSEVEERSLVDPDNRRPVDFDAAQATPRRRLRREAADHADARCGCVATDPSCSPATPRLTAEGTAAEHVLAFDRGGVVTVVTRLPVGLEPKGGWGDTTIELPEGAGATCWIEVVSSPSRRLLRNLLRNQRRARSLLNHRHRCDPG